MGSRPSTFALTNPTAYDGKAIVYTLTQLLNFLPPRWLIENVIPSEALIGLAGPPGVGKSTLALDWALCVATGIPWQDRVVEPGFALYIAAEGYTGLSVRARAWLAHRGINASKAKFGLLKGRLAVHSTQEDVETSDYDTLFDRIDNEIQVAPKLVIIDTLARCIEGDENASLDMTNFLDGAEQMIERYGSSVLVIHHKNAVGNRERGHTSFRGALGALFFLEYMPRNKDILVLKNEKQRDARECAPLGLKLEDVPGTNSVILVSTVIPNVKERGTGEVKPMRKVDMLTLLASQEDGLTFTEWRLAAGVPRRTFARRVSQLVQDGEIFKSEIEGRNSRYYVTPSVTDLAELDREED